MRQDIKPATHKEISSLLHAILFGYEQVILKLHGGDHSPVIPYMMDELEEVIKTNEFKLIDPKKTLEENMERFVQYISNKDFLKNVSMKKVGDKEYVLEIGECSFATSGVHNTLDMRKGTCPFSIVASTVLTALLSEGKYFHIKKSEFTDKGSKILLEIK